MLKNRVFFQIACLAILGFLLAGCGEPRAPEITLHEAVYNGDIESVKRLLDGGARINRKDDKGSTPLHLAVYRGNVEMVEILLERGAFVNVKDNDGDTPLTFTRNQKILNLLRSK